MSVVDSDAQLAHMEQAFSRRMETEIRTVYASVVAGERFSVFHFLGRTPKVAFALPYTDCRVYSTEEDREVWNERSIALRCSAASAKITVAILV